MAGPRENPENRTEDIDVTIKEGEKNDNDNELKIPKKVLDKIRTKFSKLEGLVIDGTKDELADLKSKIETANATMNTEKLEASLRKEVIEEKIENNEAGFDTMLTGVKETSTEQIINDLGTKIGEQFNSYGLDSKEIDNIKTGITKKIMNSGGVDNALKVIDDYLKGKEKGTQDSTKLQQKNTMLEDLVKNNSVDLKGLLEKNKNNKELLNGLLSNPKAIEEYKEGTDISNIIALQSKELQDYLVSGNDKVIGMDKKMGDIRKQASNILNNEKINEYMKKGFMEFIEKILKFLGWTELGKTILEDYNKNKDMTKSVENLKSYGIVKVDGVEKEGKNHKSIKLLDGKDLTNIQTGKLESFFSNCKEKGIDITKNDFWQTILSENNENKTIKGTVKEKVAVQNEQKTDTTNQSITKQTQPGESTKNGQFQNPQQTQQEVDIVKTYNIGEIKNDDIDTQDFTNFYKKLNNIGFITEVKTEGDLLKTTDANLSSTPTQQTENPELQAKQEEKQIIDNLIKDVVIKEKGEKTHLATYGEKDKEKIVSLEKSRNDGTYTLSVSDMYSIVPTQGNKTDIQINSLNDIENKLRDLKLLDADVSNVMKQIKENFNPATTEEAGSKLSEQQKKEKERLQNLLEDLKTPGDVNIAEIYDKEDGNKKLGDVTIRKRPTEGYFLNVQGKGDVNQGNINNHTIIEKINTIKELQETISELAKDFNNSKIEYLV